MRSFSLMSKARNENRLYVLFCCALSRRIAVSKHRNLESKETGVSMSPFISV